MAQQPTMDGVGWFLVGNAFGGALLLLFLVAGWNLALLGAFWAVTLIAWVAGRVQQGLGDPGDQRRG